MTGSQRTTLTAGALLVALLVSATVTLTRVERLRMGSTLEEVLYLPSPKVIKRLSLGYDGLMADVYWTRAVQYFGGHHASGADEFKLLAPLLEITTYLDPHLLVAYEFGANFLAPRPPNGAGEPERAIRLVENGIRANPDAWRLYYDLGFIYYFEKKDYAKAADAFQRGSRIAGAHPFMGILAASMAQHAGDMQMARMLWTATLDTTKDKQIRDNAVKHLRALKADEDVTILENIAREYHRRTGHWPNSFRQLIFARLLPGVPFDPVGKPYKLMSDGRFEVADPKALPFISQGLPLLTIDRGTEYSLSDPAQSQN
ncbi:MAG: tetratricopeptide repeat protein [Acidobacteria bacterium]|nr:tetratricopeptide repeat protein [Acidobacteriota bacterium]